MCSKCNFRQIYRFESETVWVNFDLDFTKTYTNELLFLKQNHLNSNSISSYNLYQCKSCHNVWAYSYPDNAWRGFFLPEKLAIEYEKKLKREDRIRGVVGLTILLFILIAILRSCIK